MAEHTAIVKRRPQTGELFLHLRMERPGDRATEFKQRCDGLGINRVTLYSDRYAWAERALKCGHPERIAQPALRHNSKAVHHAYSKHAEVTIPSLDDWEKQRKKGEVQKPKLVPVDFHSLASAADEANGVTEVAAVARR